jgi:putative transposase
MYVRSDRASTELIHHRGLWCTTDHVELATFECVDWYNNRQIHSGYGNMPPADFEALFYMQDEADIVAEA